MRHVLLISHFFPPMGGGGVQRVTKFVKYIAEHGWRATVVCGRPEDYWMRDETLLQELPDSTRVIATAAASGLSLLRRVRRSPAPGGGAARRSSRGFGILRRAASWFLVPDSYIGWRPFALRAARIVLRDDPPQALMSSAPPETNHVVAAALHRETGVPWLADFRDPWFGLHLYPAPTAWHRSRHAKLERAVLEQANCVVATTTWLRDLLRTRASHQREIYVIRNGYDPADFERHAAHAAHADDVTVGHGVPDAGSAKLRLAHTGMLTLTRSASALLQGLKRLLARRPELRGRVALELVGSRESANDAWVERLGLEDCVHLRGYVSHREAIATMRSADVLVLVKHTEPRYRGLIPGKLYEYLGAGRPILALVPESEAAALLRGLGCAEIAAPDAAGEIESALERFVEAKISGTLASRYPIPDVTRFTRSEQARNLAALLDKMLLRDTGGVV